MSCDRRCFDEADKHFGHDDCSTCPGRDDGTPTAVKLKGTTMTTKNQTNGYGPKLFDQVTGFDNQTNERAELIARLRNTPNWMRESYGSWKDCVLAYDRAPFEAATMMEADARRPPTKPLTYEQIRELAHRKCSRYRHDTHLSYIEYTFQNHTLDDFARAIEAYHGIK